MLTEDIKRELEESIGIRKVIERELLDKIAEVTRLIIDTEKRGGKVYAFGNGGSGAIAECMAVKFLGRSKLTRAPLRLISLTTNTSLLTAFSNDFGFEKIFSRQIEGLVSKDDIVIGISISGSSPNTLEGIKAAQKLGAKTIGLSGKGGRLAKLVDHSIVVPSSDPFIILDSFFTVAHIICDLVEKELFTRK